MSLAACRPRISERIYMENTFDIFSACSHTIGVGVMSKIWGVTSRQIYRMSADPKFAQDSTHDPISKLIETLKNVISAGRTDIADACVNRIARPLGYRMIPISRSEKPANLKMLDVAACLGRLSSGLAAAYDAGVISMSDASRLTPLTDKLIREAAALADSVEANHESI